MDNKNGELSHIERIKINTDKAIEALKKVDINIANTELVSIDVDLEKRKVEIVYRIPSNTMYATYPPRDVPDKVFKKIYSVKSGELIFDNIIQGVHIPASQQPERFEFPEEG